MSRWGRSSIHYRGRKVAIRNSGDISKLEDMFKQDFADIMKAHYDELSEVAEQIQMDAGYLAPFETGALEDSIMVRPYAPTGFGIRPGMIAHASAHDQGYDYAVIQEYNEDYDHEYRVDGQDREKDFATAHYLGGAFAKGVCDWYIAVTGKQLSLPPELEHAKNYVEDYL